MAMHVDITDPGASVLSGESVTLDAEAYGDLVMIDQDIDGSTKFGELWEATQASDGTWSVALQSTLSALTNLRRPRGLATAAGSLFMLDWWGEDLYRITDLDTGAGSELGTESEGALSNPEGVTFIGARLWAIDATGDDLWSWDAPATAPNGGIQRGSVTIAGAPRGLTVRNGNLVVLTVDGRDFAILEVTNTGTGASNSLASFSSVPTTTISGSPQAIALYRGSLWILTDASELIEVTDLSGTPTLNERADFSEADLVDPRGMCQYPVPSTYAWTSDNGGTFANAADLSTTWDSTGVDAGTDVTLTLTVTDEGGNTTSASVMVQVQAVPEQLALEAETGDPEAAFNLVLVERQELSLEADTGSPEAAFDLRAITLQQLALEADTGNPEAAFALRFIPQDVQRLALDADTGNPVAAFALRFIPQDVQELALEAATGDPEAAFALTFVPQDVQLLMLEAETGAPIAAFDLRLQDAIELVTSELVSVRGGTYSAAVEALGA